MKRLLLTLALTISSLAMSAGVDLNKSELTWHGTKVTGKHYGKMPLKSADVKLNEKGNIDSAVFVVDITKVDVTDLKGEWKTKFLTHIKSGDFFEAEKYPTAKLVVTKDTGKALEGKLTIKDKTNPISIPYTKKGKTLSGIMEFDRTKFSMIYGSGNFFKNLGDKVIHNEVKVNFSIVLK